MPQPIEMKRESAAKRQAAYDALTPAQKLERLDRAFGKDQGAKRERAKLAKKLAPKQPAAAPTEIVIEGKSGVFVPVSNAEARRLQHYNKQDKRGKKT